MESPAAKVKRLPSRPGVYIFKDRNGRIIYIGKAKSLKNRVSSYFVSGGDVSEKTMLLKSAIRDLDFIITANELEALLLESTLIKKHQPFYNIRLKDDTGYPFIKISAEEFPRLLLARRAENDGGKYFGPYSSSAEVRETIRFLQRVFPLRRCTKMKPSPCMYHHIEKCPGPCSGKVSAGEYAASVTAINMFLQGRAAEILRGLEAEMKLAAAEKHFEKAAVLRDRRAALKSIVEQRQTVVFTDDVDMDVAAVKKSEKLACVVILYVRAGTLNGHGVFFLEVQSGDEEGETLRAFLEQYYAEASTVPGSIFLSHDVGAMDSMEELLGGRTGRRVHFFTPKKGKKKEIVNIAFENAERRLEDELKKQKLDREQRRALTVALSERLGAGKMIKRIVGFDISTIQGTNTVGVAVTFTEGRPEKDGYRKFIIRGSGRDDFSSMRETVMRYFARVRDGLEPQPDLVLIDGGKGQVTAAAEGAKKAAAGTETKIIGYAKKTGVSHSNYSSIPIIFSEEEPASRLVQRVIAETHRFAVTFHRKKRGKEMIES